MGMMIRRNRQNAAEKAAPKPEKKAESELPFVDVPEQPKRRGRKPKYE